MATIMSNALMAQYDPKFRDRVFDYRFSNGRQFKSSSDNTALAGDYGLGYMGVESAGNRFMVMEDGLTRGEMIIRWENNRV